MKRREFLGSLAAPLLAPLVPIHGDVETITRPDGYVYRRRIASKQQALAEMVAIRDVPPEWAREFFEGPPNPRCWYMLDQRRGSDECVVYCRSQGTYAGVGEFYTGTLPMTVVLVVDGPPA